MPQADEAVKDVADATVVAPAAPEAEQDVMDMSLEDVTKQVEKETEDEAEITPAPSEETETKDQPASEPSSEEKLSPKSENRFQKLANENRELKDQIDALKSQEAQVATEQGLLNEVNPETGEYYTTQEIERLAFAQSREDRQQTLAQERYNLEVQQNQQTIASETKQGLTDFPMFDETSKEYNAVLAAKADALIGKSLIRDEQGTILGANISPYEILQTIADATQINSAAYKADAQKATEKMLANADVPSGGTEATKTKVDPMMEAFDLEAGL